MFKKKNIIVTGSNGLIGKKLKKYFTNEGANFFGIDIKGDKETLKCDVTNENQVSKTINLIAKKNQPDILINNAAINPGNVIELKKKGFKFSNYNTELWKKTLDVDLIGSYLMSKYCCKYFEKKNLGTIINISSIYGMVGPDQEIYSTKKKFTGYKPLEYSVSKAGLIGFSKALASFYKGTNIKVICLILGGISNKQSKKFIKNYKKKTISERLASVDEIVDYISFFASNKSSYSSGTCINIDGGALSIL